MPKKGYDSAIDDSDVSDEADGDAAAPAARRRLLDDDDAADADEGDDCGAANLADADDVDAEDEAAAAAAPRSEARTVGLLLRELLPAKTKTKNR